MVNNGLGDLKVKVGSEEIMCVRNILMNGNSTIRKLLLDEQFREVLELYEKCDLKSFLEIEKYYSGGSMELSSENVCAILRFSIYYNDNGIMLICKRYLKNHVNDSIMIEIFSMLNVINVVKLSNLKMICEDYLKLNGYEYLSNDSLLLKLNLKCLKFIINNERLIIVDESWLLNRLMYWYRSILKVEKDENSESEEVNEEIEDFISIIKTRIHLNEIKKEEISKENLLELSKLKIDINVSVNNHINIKVGEVKNVELIKLIHKNYLLFEEENEIEISICEKEMDLIESEEVKNDLIKLLNNEDIIIIEIVLNVIIENKMSEIIPKEMKNKLLGMICYDCNKNRRSVTLKCLCLFVDDVEYISTMKCLCGKEILYKILNEEYYLNSKSKELLIKYIYEMRLSIEEEEEMSKIIMNEEILSELLIKEISSFSYPQSEYLFGINEEISIIPSFDGERCEFSITPSLPSGMFIDTEKGIISGKVDRIYEKKEYEIICKNMRNEKKFKISLEFDIEFTKLNKSSNIAISNNGKLITKTANGWNHCYLNLKMENGIYHIKYQYHRNNGGGDDNIFLGLSTDNTYSGKDFYNQSTTCNYAAYDGESQYITKYCHIGTIVTSDPNFNNHGDGSIYEIIVNMNKREYWISHNNSSPVLLVKDLPSPLYPYTSIYYQFSSIELLSVSHQN